MAGQLSTLPAELIPIYNRRSRSQAFDPVAYVISKNIHRRHLTPEQKRELIAKLLKADPTKSNRQVARIVGRDDKTVAKVRTELEATADIPQLPKTGKDGKSRPARKKQATEKPAGALIGSRPIPEVGVKSSNANQLKSVTEVADEVAARLSHHGRSDQIKIIRVVMEKPSYWH